MQFLLLERADQVTTEALIERVRATFASFAANAESSVYPWFQTPVAPAEHTLQRGKCEVVEYEGDDDDDDVDFVSAGTLSAHAGEHSVELQCSGGSSSKWYGAKTFSGDGPLSPDVPVEIEASGDRVPAFHTTVQLAPLIHVLTSPEAGIAKTEAFTLNWEPISDDVDVKFTIQGDDAHVTCVADGRLGTAEVSADAVEFITTRPLDDGTLSLGIVVSKTTTFKAGGYEIHVHDRRSSSATPLSIH